MATHFIFSPGESHRVYSPWGCKESDTTERLSQTQKENMSSLELENSLCYSGGPCWLPVLYVKVLVAHLCLTLCDPMNCSPPGSSVHGFSQARILAWDAMPYSRGIFPTQGLNPRLLCLLHRQADSLPLHHLRSHLSKQILSNMQF